METLAAAKKSRKKPGLLHGRKMYLEALETRGKRAYRPRVGGLLRGPLALLAPKRNAKERKSFGQMNFGEFARKRLHVFTLLAAALVFVQAPQAAFAQSASEADLASPNLADPTVPAAEAAEGTAAEGGEEGAEAPAFDYYGPEMIKGQPEPGNFNFQGQYSEDGDYALWMHDTFLLPMMAIISLLVLLLLLWVVARYNRRANAVPSKTSHNTLVEVVWTLVPVLILVVIAIPSITLLARQYESPGDDAITVKATGYQWYWGYTYPDHGGFEVISNMKDEGEALVDGEPPQLAADNRMVVPVGTEIRLQTTGADVIHSFGVPSLWFKLDAVPGRLNERKLVIEEPGIYYGQCMELCGARHAYMPIVIEARPQAEFAAWIRAQGGTLPGEEELGATDTELPGLQEPESSVEGAPGAGAPPTQDTAPADGAMNPSAAAAPPSI
jgi:cytochrome c oxidase subunit 2